MTATLSVRTDEDLAIERRAFDVDSPAFDLFQAALVVGRVEQPTLDPTPALDVVERLARRVRAVRGEHTTLRAGVEALVNVLFVEEGLRGDEQTYDDPVNSFLHRVLERRRGLPISLSLLTCEVARRAGLEAYGIAFPGHFLVGLPAGTVGDAPDVLVLDPFDGGRLRTAQDLEQRLHRVLGQPVPLVPEHLLPAPPLLVLERLLNNLRASYIRRRALPELERVLSRLLVLAPGNPRRHLERARVRRLLLDDGGARADVQAVRAAVGAAEIEGADALDRLLDEDAQVVH